MPSQQRGIVEKLRTKYSVRRIWEVLGFNINGHQEKVRILLHPFLCLFYRCHFRLLPLYE